MRGGAGAASGPVAVTDERLALLIEVVGHVIEPESREQHHVGGALAFRDFRVLEIGHVENASEARRTIEDLIRVHDEIRMLAPTHHHWRRGVRGAEIATMERRIVVVGGKKLRLAAILDVDDDNAGIAPGRIDTVVVVDDLVALDDLLSPIGAVAIERAELLALLLAGDVPGADLLDRFHIAVVDDLQALAVELGRKLRAGIDVAVVGIEPVRLAVGRDRNEGKLLRLSGIRHVVERDAGLGLLAGGLLVGIAARVIVVAEDQNLFVLVDAQIVATRARIAGNKGERLDVLRIAHVGDHDAEQRWRRVETAEIPNAVVDTYAVEPRADLAARPPLAFGPRRALGNLEVALPDQLEILG